MTLRYIPWNQLITEGVTLDEALDELESSIGYGLEELEDLEQKRDLQKRDFTELRRARIAMHLVEEMQGLADRLRKLVLRQTTEQEVS